MAAGVCIVLYLCRRSDVGLASVQLPSFHVRALCNSVSLSSNTHLPAFCFWTWSDMLFFATPSTFYIFSAEVILKHNSEPKSTVRSTALSQTSSSRPRSNGSESILIHTIQPAGTTSLHSPADRVRMPYRMAAFVFEYHIRHQLSFEYRMRAAPIQHSNKSCHPTWHCEQELPSDLAFETKLASNKASCASWLDGAVKNIPSRASVRYGIRTRATSGLGVHRENIYFDG